MQTQAPSPECAKFYQEQMNFKFPGSWGLRNFLFFFRLGMVG